MGMPTVILCHRPGEEDLATALEGDSHAFERATDGYRAIELAERTSPAAVLIQLGVEGPPASQLLRRLKRVAPETRLVCILPGPEEPGVSPADLLRSGADGVLAPSPEGDELRWALDGVLQGGSALSPTVARELVEPFTQAAHREREWARSLADSARQTEELARTKAEFLSNVSHELRTPLTIIKGVAEVVGRFGGGSEEQRRMLGKLEESATKLTRMVENLLTLAEMERGDFELNIDECDVAALVREGAQEAASKYPKVSVDVRVPLSIPARADADRIREVIRQLVDNGCRYSEDGDSVTVLAKRAAEGIVVSVTDQGRGLERRVVAAAFGEAFSPGEEILTKERAGLGLGLNLARSFVALHGGILSAEPIPGGGSKVSFVIPPEARVKPGSASEHEGEEEEAAAEEGDPLDRLREIHRRRAQSETQAHQS
jgi:signal transduction histidine kinase